MYMYMYSKAMILQLWYRFLDLDSQRGMRGVVHTRGESSARIKGATGIRRAEETLFLLYPQAPWWPPRSLPISEEVNLNVYTTWL